MNSSLARELVYLGWQGNANFGDELIYEYWQAALQRPLAITAPLTLRRYLVTEARHYFPDRIRIAGSERAVLLGGGTTVGFGTWAHHTRLAQRMYGATRVFAAGAGAAERGDAFTLDRQPHDWQAWRALGGFELLGVRGPLTASACAHELSERPVIGDPALAYPDVVPLTPVKRHAIGLCLGSEGSSRFDVAAVAQGVRAAADRIGAEIVLFQMTDADAPVTAALREALGSVTIERFDGDVHDMMNRIAGCTAFISERLHGTIAAVATGVATTPLSYASKCDDFWLSVTDERSPLGLDCTAEQVAAAVIESLDTVRLASIAARVTTHRRALASAAASLRSWLDTGELSTFVPSTDEPATTALDAARNAGGAR